MATEDISTLQIKVSGNGITENTNKLNKLADAADKAEKAVKRLGTDVITSGMSASTGATVALSTAIMLLSSNITTLVTKTHTSTASTQSHTHAMRDAHAAARGLTGSLGALWLTYGNVLPLMAGAAIGASFKNIVKVGADVEHTLEGIRVRGQESVQSINQMREVILSLGQGVYGPQQVAEAFEVLILAGLNAKQALASVRDALNLATTGGVGIEKAASTMVAVGTAMGYAAEGYAAVGDTIAKTAAVSMSGVTDLSEAFKSASAVGKMYGVSLNDVAVQLAALSNMKITGSAAGTSVKNFYKELISESKKVQDTLASMKIGKLDIVDSEGRMRPIIELVASLSKGLNSLSAAERLVAKDRLANERGIKDMIQLMDLYEKKTADGSNELQKLYDRVADHAGYAALSAMQLSLTTKSQMESVWNSLKVSFEKVFVGMEPQVNSVARALRTAFASPEFLNMLKAVATALANVFTTIVRNVPTIMGLVAAFTALKVMSSVTAMVAAFGATVTAAIGAIGAAATTVATITAVLSGLGVVLAIGAAAWATYAFWKNKGLNADAANAAKATNDNLLDSLKEEAKRVKEATDLRIQGLSGREVDMKMEQDKSLQKFKQNEQQVVAISLMKQHQALMRVDTQLWSEYNKNPEGMKARLRASGKQDDIFKLNQLGEAIKAEKDYADAKEASDKRVLEAEKGMKQVRSEYRRQENVELEIQRNTAMKVEQEITNKLKSTEAPKGQLAIVSEILNLERAAAGYKAKAESMRASAEAEVRQLETVNRAKVESDLDENRFKEKGSERYRDRLMQAAYNADVAKTDQLRAIATTELENKLNKLAAGEAAYQASLKDGSTMRMGTLEKEAAYIIKFNSVEAGRAEKITAAARAQDEQNRVIEKRSKLETAAGSAGQRAQQYIDQADAMQELGKAGKQTALQLAEAEIEKMRLNNTGSEFSITLRREKGALEDLGYAYLSLTKLNTEYRERGELDNALGVANVIGAESAKVEAHRAATQAIIDSSISRAQAAITVAEASKDPEAVANAKATYAKITAEAKKAGDNLKKYFTIDIKVAGLKDISNVFSGLAKSAGAFGDKFSHVGKAFEGLSAGVNSLAAANEAEGITDEERTEKRIGAYGEMAGAAANFFQEGSKGYNTLMGVSKIFHAAEMGMAMIRMGKLAVEAVLGQAKGDPYTAFARMAAMAAVVGALGFAVGGGLSSGSGGKSAADVQKEQGTGSVFGDAEAKSESILKSMELLKTNSDVSLPLTQSMLKSLQSIEASMTGLTNLVVRTTGVSDGTNLGIATGTISKSLGGLWGKTTQNIVDSGLSFGGSVSSLQAGQGFSQYASVDKTKSSMFGLKKKTSNSVVTEGLNAELSTQFGLIFTNLENTLVTAASALGKEGKSVSEAINNLVIDTTTVSLKDLKGQDLQDAINGVISKTMDQIAEAAFPAMGAFRQVGEGYAQTVIRVASGIEQAQVALKGFGITSIAYTDVINKTGDVAYEMVQQSIALKEAGSGVGQVIANVAGSVSELAAAYKELITMRELMVTMNLGSGLNADTINGAGGTKELSTALTSYFSKFFTNTERAAIEADRLGKEFGALGYALPSSRGQLREWIETAAKAGDQSTVGGLLKLADAFAELGESADSLVPTIEVSLKRAMDTLTRSVEAEKKRVETLYKEMSTSAKVSYEATMKHLKAKAEADKAYVKAQTDIIKEHVKDIQKIMGALADAVKATSPMLTQAERYADSMNTVKAGVKAAANGQSIGGVAGLEEAVKELGKPAEGMYSSLEDYKRGQAEANVVLSSLERAGTKQLSEAERSIAALEAINTSNELAIEREETRYKEEQDKLDAWRDTQMEYLDLTLELAQQQIDILLGIDTSVLSLGDALRNFQLAVGNAEAQSGKPSGSTATAVIESFYKTLLNRSSDAGGLKFWQDRAASGVSLAEIKAGFMNSEEYLGKIPKFDIGTNFVPDDMLAMVHKGERIIPAADNAELMRRTKEEDKESSASVSNEQVAAKLDQLILAIQTGDVANVQKTNELVRIIRDWDGNGMPPERKSDEVTT